MARSLFFSLSAACLLIGASPQMGRAESPQPSQPSTDAGYVTLLPEGAQGTLTVRSSQGTTRQIHSGDHVAVSEHLVTGADQTAVLHLPDQSQVALSPGSDLSVAEIAANPSQRSADLVLEKGLVHASVTPAYSAKHPFYIRTKTATMGVRGTEFVAEHSDAQGTTMHTLEGAVAMGKSKADLSNPKASVLVEAGRMSRLDGRMAMPAQPKKFNRKTLFTYLNGQSPSFAKHVDHQVALRARHAERGVAHEREKGSEKKQRKKPWKAPKHRKQTGHH